MRRHRLRSPRGNYVYGESYASHVSPPVHRTNSARLNAVFTVPWPVPALNGFLVAANAALQRLYTPGHEIVLRDCSGPRVRVRVYDRAIGFGFGVRVRNILDRNKRG